MKAYVHGNEVIILEFADSKYYGPMARIVFKEPVPWRMSPWIPTDKIIIQ